MVGSLVRATRVTTLASLDRVHSAYPPSPPPSRGYSETGGCPHHESRFHPSRGIRGIRSFDFSAIIYRTDWIFFSISRPRGFTTVAISPIPRTHDPIVVYFLLRVTAGNNLEYEKSGFITKCDRSVSRDIILPCASNNFKFFPFPFVV